MRYLVKYTELIPIMNVVYEWAGMLRVGGRMKKTEEAIGWGVRVGGGPLPYLAYFFSTKKEEANAECTEHYHRPVRVAIVPLAEYRRLKKLEKQ